MGYGKWEIKRNHQISGAGICRSILFLSDKKITWPWARYITE
jgi:hypothetical protein